MPNFFDAHAPGTGRVFSFVDGYVIIARRPFIGLSFVVLERTLGSDPSPMPVTNCFTRLTILAHRAAGRSDHHDAMSRWKNFPAV